MSNIKDVRYKLRLGISWSMTARLRDDIVVVVGRTRPRSLLVMHGAPLGVPCGPRYQMILLSCYIVDSLLSSDHV